MKMQNVSFRTIDDFLVFLPEGERKIVDNLRRIIFDCMPNVSERLSYNVPFYKRNKNICFIWPSSILWGKSKSYEGVRFGFTSGHLLQDEIAYLDKGNRKFVCYKDFLSCEEIDEPLLKSYLFEALDIDNQ